MSERYTIVLEITCDDPDDDPRKWPFDDLLAAPEDAPERFVQYVTGARHDRNVAREGQTTA